MAALLARSPAVEWADALVLAGPRAWLRGVAAAHPRLGARGFAQAAAWTPLPCGTGLCGACAFETRRGWRLACKDGPFFQLGEALG
jgi:dihydroorotate dehydrogenase electron transfer subunit